MVETDVFRALLDAAPDAIVAVDAAGRIVLVNTQAEALFGYERNELVGELVDVLVPGAVRGVHPAHRASYVAHPVPRPMGAGVALAGRRRDGTEFPAEISLSSIETADGVLVSAAVRDVTERKRAEAMFRGLLEAAPDAIVGVGADGLILLVNAQAERLFGYARHELIGHPLDMLVPDHAKRVHPGHRASYFADPKPRPMGAGMQLAGRRKDGTEFPAEISLSALDMEDGRRMVSAAVRDVTERIEAAAERERLRAQAERERLEGRMHQSQRLESLGQLAGGVAHDFNNLLAVILNYTTFVHEEVAAAAARPDGEGWESVRHDVEQVSLAAERATELTHQLLAFGRREVVHPQPLSLDSVVHGVEELLRRTLGEHVRLQIETQGDAASVMADRGQLEQVLVNLAVNARDAMPGGGVLTIETRDVVVDEDYAAARPDITPGGYVRLRVSDTGAGMTDDVIRRAFEPFFTTKPKGEGSGLGLATVYGIVTQAGGAAQIYSEPGLGTTFTALFPATDAKPAAGAAAASDPGVSGGETVLVVEDEDALREVTRRILARHGYTVLLASCGDDAIELAERHDGTIHLLLTDVVMPGMLGIEVSERVRAIRPNVPVLYMSGYAQPVLAKQGTMDPSVTLLEKPFTEAALLGKVRDLLGSGGQP